jgi:hypothetical protein
MMRKSDLVKKLQEIPDDCIVGILDWRKNLHDDLGDGNGTTSGIYVDLDFEFIGDNDNKIILLKFNNDDYTDEGQYNNFELLFQ